MAENRMLIVPAALVAKIDENRGDMPRAEFLDFLISHYLAGEEPRHEYVTEERLAEFEQSVKDLLRTFLDFFVTYGLELGQHKADSDVEALSLKLQGLGRPGKSAPKGKLSRE
ncbi:MAG: hypothetical protein HY535_03830 [Chloroflexi bacterium]|nr:hypothetical protein [Chloroflexota bacterium]